MHYLITGHTGFKGAWLTLLLQSLGHEVSGIALDPELGSLFEVTGVSENLIHDIRHDVRVVEGLEEAFRTISPDVIVHMAAQPLVRHSYVNPRETFETNVMGTFNVLEAARATSSIAAQLIVTTDKVYRNVNQREGYLETDALGGRDPYSASKAMADILATSWSASFDSAPIGIARAGNVIGGGDVCRDRLMPDLLAAFTTGEVAAIRYPQSVRPWQHVLDCLSGYYALSLALLDGRAQGEWNFGPAASDAVEVGEIATLAAQEWGQGAAWKYEQPDAIHEAELLVLDSSKAEMNLGWNNTLDHRLAVRWTVEWSKSVLEGRNPREVTLAQIQRFKEASSLA